MLQMRVMAVVLVSLSGGCVSSEKPPAEEGPRQEVEEDTDTPEELEPEELTCAPGTVLEEEACLPCEAGTYCPGGVEPAEACVFADLDQDPATPCEVEAFVYHEGSAWCAEDAQKDRMCWGSVRMDYEAHTSGDVLVFENEYELCAYDDELGPRCTWWVGRDPYTALLETQDLLVNARYIGANHRSSEMSVIDADGAYAWGAEGQWAQLQQLGPLVWGERVEPSVDSLWFAVLEESGRLVSWTSAGEDRPGDLPLEVLNVDRAWVGAAGLCAAQDDGITCWGEAFEDGGESITDAYGEIQEVAISAQSICVLTEDEQIRCRADRSEEGWGEVTFDKSLGAPEVLTASATGFCLWDSVEGITCWDDKDYPETADSQTIRRRAAPEFAAPNDQRYRTKIIAGPTVDVMSLNVDGELSSAMGYFFSSTSLPVGTLFSDLMDGYQRDYLGLDLNGYLVCNSEMDPEDDEERYGACEAQPTQVYDDLVRLGRGWVIAVTPDKSLNAVCAATAYPFYVCNMSLLDVDALQAAVQGHPEYDQFVRFYGSTAQESPVTLLEEAFCADKGDGSLPVCFSALGELIEIPAFLSESVVLRYQSSQYATAVFSDGSWGSYDLESELLVWGPSEAEAQDGETWWPGEGVAITDIRHYEATYVLAGNGVVYSSNGEEWPLADEIVVADVDDDEAPVCVIRQSDGGLACRESTQRRVIY